jgi:hypothetical protein
MDSNDRRDACNNRDDINNRDTSNSRISREPIAERTLVTTGSGDLETLECYGPMAQGTLSTVETILTTGIRATAGT